jgi:spore maturation protein CgeB
MCKVLLVGSHLGYNLEHYVKMALEKRTHSVTFIGYRSMLGALASPVRMAITRSKAIRTLAEPVFLNEFNKRLKEEALKVEPDLVLSIKGEAVLPSTIEWFRHDMKVKTALWYPDDPRFFNSLVKCVAPHYDYIFTASEKGAEMYEEIGVKNVYPLPFACEPSVHRKIRLSEDDMRKYECDVCFVGSYLPGRARIIRRLSVFNVKVYGPYWGAFAGSVKANTGVWGPEMAKAFNAAKIVLNIHVKSDLAYKPNMRVFEATGSGAFLLTDKPYGLEKLFRSWEEVMCYNNESELVKLVKYYLDNDEERMNISARGQERAYREHTYQDRVKQILEKIRL